MTMASNATPRNTTRRYLKIARELADQIDSGAYSVGARLPPERELAVTTGVSRTVLREALLALEIRGYVEVRIGSGVLVLPESYRAGAAQGDIEELRDAAPSCVPSRASLFSGYYPHTNGVLANGTEWSRTWVSDLADAGYHCVNIGKMHTIPYDAKAGFHERFVVENKDRFLEGRWFTDEWDKAILNAGHAKPGRLSYRAREDYRNALGAFEWTLDDKLHSDSFIGGFTEWWLDKKPREKPLFLSIGFPARTRPTIRRRNTPRNTWRATCPCRMSRRTRSTACRRRGRKSAATIPSSTMTRCTGTSSPPRPTCTRCAPTTMPTSR